MTSANLSRWSALAAFVERWVLSSIYLALMAARIYAYTQPGPERPFALIAHDVLMLILNGFIAAALLLSRRPSVPPQRARDIVVPLVTSFFFLLYSTKPYLAPELVVPQLPPAAQPASILFGFALGLLGPLIALWGVWHLGRSFGVFVTVREVVLRGPYRYVRHPMYLGYICLLVGLLAIENSVAFMILVPVHIYLFAVRARLEEERLAQASPEYRSLMSKSGFLLPKFW